MYIIILVYIGVMIIAVAGTPRQEKAKSYFTNWVAGLVILIFLPHYGFPLLFKINDAFVAYVGKDASNMDTYYTVLERNNEISGGDSMTEAIRKLEEKKEETTDEAEKIQTRISSQTERLRDEIVDDYCKYIERETGRKVIDEMRASIANSLGNWLNRRYTVYHNFRKSNDATHEQAIENLRTVLYQDRGYLLSTAEYDYIIENDVIGKLSKDFEELFEKNKEIEQIEQDITTLQNDILGIMRSYAGEYNRLIFGILFLMLLFQLIGLLILYFKRLFMIAILITIFPLIMLFYCIDKMADNTAQTLSLWFKEFLSNIFIQSIHAVIYIVLVEMGLEVFKRDNGNWILLVCAMMLIIPAESIMKSLFNLNGFSLGQIGGMLEKATIGIGALKSLATAGKRGNDKAIVAKEKQFSQNMQRKQIRADNKKVARDYNRARNDIRKDGMIKNTKTSMYNMGDKMYNLGNKAREERKKIHNFTSRVGNYTRYARNAAAITAGAIYGLAGGDVNSLAQGAAIARTFSGKTGKDKDYTKKRKETRDKERQAKIKNRVKGAYKRQKP